MDERVSHRMEAEVDELSERTGRVTRKAASGSLAQTAVVAGVDVTNPLPERIGEKAPRLRVTATSRRVARCHASARARAQATG
jgi:hypothetical protein